MWGWRPDPKRSWGRPMRPKTTKDRPAPDRIGDLHISLRIPPDLPAPARWPDGTTVWAWPSATSGNMPDPTPGGKAIPRFRTQSRACPQNLTRLAKLIATAVNPRHMSDFASLTNAVGAHRRNQHTRGFSTLSADSGQSTSTARPQQSSPGFFKPVHVDVEAGSAVLSREPYSAA